MPITKRAVFQDRKSSHISEGVRNACAAGFNYLAWNDRIYRVATAELLAKTGDVVCFDTGEVVDDLMDIGEITQCES